MREKSRLQAKVKTHCLWESLINGSGARKKSILERRDNSLMEMEMTNLSLAIFQRILERQYPSGNGKTWDEDKGD